MRRIHEWSYSKYPPIHQDVKPRTGQTGKQAFANNERIRVNKTDFLLEMLQHFKQEGKAPLAFEELPQHQEIRCCTVKPQGRGVACRLS